MREIGEGVGCWSMLGCENQHERKTVHKNILNVREIVEASLSVSSPLIAKACMNARAHCGESPF